MPRAMRERELGRHTRGHFLLDRELELIVTRTHAPAAQYVGMHLSGGAETAEVRRGAGRGCTLTVRGRVQEVAVDDEVSIAARGHSGVPLPIDHVADDGRAGVRRGVR